MKKNKIKEKQPDAASKYKTGNSNITNGKTLLGRTGQRTIGEEIAPYYIKGLTAAEDLHQYRSALDLSTRARATFS